jgi:hypothetical protein
MVIFMLVLTIQVYEFPYRQFYNTKYSNSSLPVPLLQRIRHNHAHDWEEALLIYLLPLLWLQHMSPVELFVSTH